MSKNLDRGLDDIIAEGRSNGPRNRAPRRRERQEQPRDGVRKSYRSDSRNLDSEWVHDRFDEHDNHRGPMRRRRRESPERRETKGGPKIRVENLHYDLTEEDLDELFRRIGPVTKLQLRYDRAGRSEGVAFVTYETKEHAEEAVRQFDGANANGQPIRLSILPSRNPFDSAFMPGKPLSERISNPDGRTRSLSPQRKYDMEDAARKGIDRYIPDGRSRSKSPGPQRRGGRRPGARREGGRGPGRGNGREQTSTRGERGNPRSKKTQEELDAEMADYFGGGGGDAPAAEAGQGGDAAAAPVSTEDVDMIE